MCRSTVLVTLLTLLAIDTGYAANDAAIDIRLRQARAHWNAFRLADAVTAWKEVLTLDPENETASRALTHLDRTVGRNQAFLKTVQHLVDSGLTGEAERALKHWDPPHLAPDSQATLRILEGRLAQARGRSDVALPYFDAALRIAQSDHVKQRARLAQATALSRLPLRQGEARALLEGVVKDEVAPDIIDAARWHLLELDRGTVRDQISALGAFLRQSSGKGYATKAHTRLATLLCQDRGQETARSLEHRLAAIKTAATRTDRDAAQRVLHTALNTIADSSDLSWLSDRLDQLSESGRNIPYAELALVAFERLVTFSSGERAIHAARRTQAIGAKLMSRYPHHAHTDRWRSRQARGALMEGQTLLMQKQDLRAIRQLTAASSLYQELLRQGHRDAPHTLQRIGALLEARGRPDAAAYHYRLVATAFPGDAAAADALWRLAMVLRHRLDQPLEALRVIKRYHDLYPPVFRTETSARERIRKLGYADIAAFQLAQGLKADGVAGAMTRAALKREEANFQEILPGETKTRHPAGRMVHKTIFDMAKQLEARGRFREALHVYREFLSLYPGNCLGDDAQLAIARIFKKNDCFAEAITAYERLIEDYPKGNTASHGYIEAAACAECLGDWQRAEELYDLYQRKFPRYRQAEKAAGNLAAVRKLLRYADLTADASLAGSKQADALYEMGTILYKELKNRQKAVDLFARVSKDFPGSYHAPDALFSAGVCFLHEENFQEARDTFTGLIAAYPDSRLSDDARFWIGHTYEYQARALGKLDTRLITLHRRSAAEARSLRRDLALRRLFNPAAAHDGPAWHRPHPGVTEIGHTRDRVRADLTAAIDAYRTVIDASPLGDMAQKALLRIGHIYSDYLKDPDRAVGAYRELLEKYPGSSAAVDAQFAVGEHYLEKKELVKAERAITLFLSSFPNHPKAATALLNLAECHRGQSEWLKALDDYQSYLNRHPHAANTDKIRHEIEWIKKYRF